MDAVETMAWFKEAPWHGKGKEATADNCRNWTEFCDLSGLNWDTGLIPLWENLFGEEFNSFKNQPGCCEFLSGVQQRCRVCIQKLGRFVQLFG